MLHKKKNRWFWERRWKTRTKHQLVALNNCSQRFHDFHCTHHMHRIYTTNLLSKFRGFIAWKYSYITHEERKKEKRERKEGTKEGVTAKTVRTVIDSVTLSATVFSENTKINEIVIYCKFVSENGLGVCDCVKRIFWKFKLRTLFISSTSIIFYNFNGN